MDATGDRHGRGILMWGAGNCAEGECVHGKEQGKWVLRNLHGAVFEGDFADGKKHGPWVEAYSNGDRSGGTFADGIKTGPWKMIKADGTMWETVFQDGQMDHDWQVRVTGGHGASHHELPNSCSPPSQQQSSSKSHQIASDSPDSASERNRENISRITSWMDKVQTLPLAFSCQFAIHPSACSLPTPPFISPSSTHVSFLSGNQPSGSRPDGCARVCRFSGSSLGKITGTIARPVILDD
jgi:hypothetical protein